MSDEYSHKKETDTNNDLEETPKDKNNQPNGFKNKNPFEKKRLYSFIKQNKNKSIINEVKSQIDNLDIEKITIFNRSLIYWAVVLEHNHLIEELFEFNLFNKKTYLDEIFSFNVINKSPEILNLIITQIKQLPSLEQKEIIQNNIEKITQSCFREENICLIESFLFNNLREEEKREFILKAVEYTNIPILQTLNSFDGWHHLINSMENDILNQSLKPYHEIYKKLIKKATIAIVSQPNEELNQSVLTLEKKSKNPEDNQSITIPTVIKKRKKNFS